MFRFSLALIGLTALAADNTSYCWGFLNGHPDRKAIPEAEAQEIQKAHLGHLDKMAADGRLLAAGPLATPNGPRGLLVFRCDSATQAASWAGEDPAVMNQRLSVEIYRWAGSGTWGEPLSSKLKADATYKYSMNRLPFAILTRGPKLLAAPMPLDVRDRHTAYTAKLAVEGKVRSFGFFDDAKDKLGVVVFSEMPIESARKLMDADPAVQDGYVTPIAHVWFVAGEAVPGQPAK